MTQKRSNLLPFMKKKTPQTGVIVQDLSPKSENTQENQEDNSNEDLEICAMDIMSAIAKKDIKGLATALQAMFEIMESQPHEEENNEEIY